MRSLAYDLGQALECGGHLKSLVRLRSGPFEIQASVTLEEFHESVADGTWTDHLHSADVVLGHMPALIAGRRNQDLIRDGRPISVGETDPADVPSQRCRAYTTDGRFMAILRLDRPMRQWKPEKVFHDG
jgi:tRNA pseudouridine55 synthase